VLKSDGRWRIVIFAGDITQKDEAKTLSEVSNDYS
jgi:hypothetical protein